MEVLSEKNIFLKVIKSLINSKVFLVLEMQKNALYIYATAYSSA